MKMENVLASAMLVSFPALIGGCHELVRDDYWVYDNAYDSYRDGFRHGRAYKRRRENSGGQKSNAWLMEDRFLLPAPALSVNKV